MKTLFASLLACGAMLFTACGPCTGCEDETCPTCNPTEEGVTSGEAACTECEGCADCESGAEATDCGCGTESCTGENCAECGCGAAAEDEAEGVVEEVEEEVTDVVEGAIENAQDALEVEAP